MGRNGGKEEVVGTTSAAPRLVVDAVAVAVSVAVAAEDKKQNQSCS